MNSKCIVVEVQRVEMKEHILNKFVHNIEGGKYMNIGSDRERCIILQHHLLEWARGQRSQHYCQAANNYKGITYNM